MPFGAWTRRGGRTLSALSFSILMLTSQDLRAEDQLDGLHTLRIVDVLNVFSNVGALIYFVEPNDFGIPPGIVTHCSGTLIHERVLLVAGHCTAPTAGGLLPFIKAFVSFSPTALDRSTWKAEGADCDLRTPNWLLGRPVPSTPSWSKL